MSATSCRKRYKITLKIKMIKAQEENRDSTVGHIIAQDYRKSKALSSRGVDYSCDGHRTLSEVFNGKEGDLEKVLQEWQQLDRQPPQKDMDFLGWDIVFLTNYIIQLHHRFVSAQTKFITDLAYKVAESNRARGPVIRSVAELFDATGKRLEAKGRQEEQELFPYLISLQEAMTQGTRLKSAPFGPVAGPIRQIKAEGEQIVAALGEIRKLTNNFTPPPYTSSTCNILYKLLAEYEADTLLHLHLENNILFPRAVQTEDCLRANQQIT